MSHMDPTIFAACALVASTMVTVIMNFMIKRIMEESRGLNGGLNYLGMIK